MRFRAKIVHVAVAGLPVVGCGTSDVASKTDTPAKQDVKQDVKQDPVGDPKVPIVITKPEDIPVALGGAPMPYEPPPSPTPTPTPTPTPGPAPSSPAPAASASAPAPAPASPAKPTAITLAHNHPPGEPCKPLTREEVERALADLRN